MTRFIKKLAIDKDFTFSGDQKEFIITLQEAKDINFKLLNSTEIKFYPDISFGTVVFSGGSVDGINVIAKTSPIEQGRLRINFQTKIRVEHYLTIGAFIFIYAVTLFSDTPWWMLLFYLGIWIICHVWFQFIYRVQENLLIEKITKRCRLVEM